MSVAGRTALALTALACGASATALPAQRPHGAETMTAEAVAESLTVLRELRSHLEKNRDDAAAWYRRGVIAWALHDRDRTPGGFPGLDWTLLGREADVAIRTAEAIEPDNIRYKLTLGQYFLGTGLIFTRVQSYNVFERALTTARALGDPALVAEAAVERGRVHWRRYDPGNFGAVPASVTMRAREINADSVLARTLNADEPQPTTGRRQPISRRSLRAARDLLAAEFSDPGSGFPGESDYIRAEEFFREAYEANPAYTRAFRQLAMLLADRERWAELRGTASTRLRAAPRDAWAWLALGLAAHREKDEPVASMAFDSALVFLEPAERVRLDHIERIFRPADSATFDGLSAPDRRTMERLYWLAADPLWSDPGSEPRTEFLARVTFAELRWTVEELQRRGADSDRGMIHIRYGPADARQRVEAGGESWWYDYARMGFVFTGAPTYATAYFSNPAFAYRMMDSLPVRWDNIADVDIDSMPSQYARFRAPGDSVDVFIAAAPTVAAIRRSSDVAAPVRTDIWMLRDGALATHRDSIVATEPGTRSWSVRTAPGRYVYRVESRAPGALRASRANAIVTTREDSATGFTLRGFGMSDLLLGSEIRVSGPPAQRWNALAITPLAGAVEGSKELTLAWENYDLSETAGAANFLVAITIRRERTAVGRIRAQILGGLTSALTREVTNDRFELEYDRRVPHAPTIVEHVTIGLGDTPPGTYLVTLEVTDRVTRQRSSRTTRIEVR